MEKKGPAKGKPPVKNLLHQIILDLRDQSLSCVGISAILGCNERTVRRYLKCGGEKKAKNKVKKLDPFEGHIREALKANPDISPRAIYRMIHRNDYKGCETEVRSLVYRIRSQTYIGAYLDWYRKRKR